MSEFPRVAYRRTPVPAERVGELAGQEVALARERRSVREFSDRPVPRQWIEAALRIAGTAPSGANRQPWRFVAIGDPELKRRIREGAEAEEREFYERRAPQAWLEALAPIGTDWRKPFLEIVPWIVVVFCERHGVGPDGAPVKNYYASESVGIAVGMLIAALHRFGLATLTHTPAPMGFLNQICQRPGNEKPFVMLPIGYAAEDATVPDLSRRPESDWLFWR